MRIMVGTIGQSILATDDDGEHWQRLAPRNGVHSDGIVRTLVSHPADPRVLLAGTDKGILRSEDGGRCWEGLGGPLSDQTVWRIAFHPKDKEVLFAGTGTPSRPAIYRSGDSGQTWAELDCDIASDCDNVGVPRVTDIAIDPLAPDNMWASIEVDGARHSTDGGRTWSAVDPKVITNPDHHAVVVSPGPPKSVFIVVNNEIWVSRDEGASWQPVGVKQRFPYHHVRDLVIDPADPRSAWATIGDATPGRTGSLARTRDAGDTWDFVDMPVQPNSAMWVLRMQADTPGLMLAASRYGYLYRSDDAGQTWAKLWREFSEVSSIVWSPN
ncbi:MAG TPA: hypothetical protein VK457_10220 [Chloroflexota bacterium]|nr:hypothetical protein [Chloroflexota bacterium]